MAIIFNNNKQPAAAWPSLAAPGVSLCGKARESEEEDKEKRVFKCTLYKGGRKSTGRMFLWLELDAM